MRRPTLVIVSAAALLAGGCSQSSSTPSGASASKPSTSSQASAPSQPAPIDPAARQAIAASAGTFMRAILSGDRSGAAPLLTATAAQRYAADPSVLTPLGMQVEKLALGEVRLLSADEAAAQCLVTEPGAESAQEVCCLLKREPAGWRVCGMACDTGQGEPVVISFEDAPEAQNRPTQFVEQPGATSTVPRTAANPEAGEYR